MGLTVPNELGEACSSARWHVQIRRALERELVCCWEAGVPLRDGWEMISDLVPQWTADGQAALLASFWFDMPCGCTFGALRCVHVPAEALPA